MNSQTCFSIHPFSFLPFPFGIYPFLFFLFFPTLPFLETRERNPSIPLTFCGIPLKKVPFIPFQYISFSSIYFPQRILLDFVLHFLYSIDLPQRILLDFVLFIPWLPCHSFCLSPNKHMINLIHLYLINHILNHKYTLYKYNY